jgi:hypothetical protein
MSRISAPGVIIASSAVSAVVALCALGLIAAGSPAAAKAEKTHPAGRSPVLRSSGSVPSNRAAMSGSHRGVWFDLPDALGSAALEAGLLRHLGDAQSATGAGGSQPQTQTPVAPAPAATPAPPAPAPTPAHQQSRSAALSAVSGNPREIAQALAAARGWSGSQWLCLDALWQHESRYQTTVRNATSGAYGIPQALPASKMATAGADWRTNPVTQIQWGLGYIADRYGSPCGAWSYWTRHYSY